MELMVVVIIIGILAALAIPSIIKAQDDRRAYNNAGGLGLLLRSARMRAIGRGAAVAVRLHADGTADRGTFQVYEAVSYAPNGAVINLGNGTSTVTQTYPVSSCAVTRWGILANSGLADIAMQYVEGVNMNGTLEGSMNLQSGIRVLPAWGANAPKTVWICFTPTGRVFASPENNAGVPDFTNPVAFTSIDVCVIRDPTTAVDCSSTIGSGPVRHVLVPPSGMARVYSQ